MVADVTTGTVHIVSPGPGEPLGISPRDDVVAIQRPVTRGYEVHFREISVP
jgi:hypothetical protein